MGSYASQCVAATIRGALKAGFSVYSAGPVIRDYEKPEFRTEIDNIQSDQFYLYDFV